MLNVNNFDGQLFQWIYLKAKSNNSADELCQLYMSENQQQELNKIFQFVTSDGDRIKCR